MAILHVCTWLYYMCVHGYITCCVFYIFIAIYQTDIKVIERSVLRGFSVIILDGIIKLLSLQMTVAHVERCPVFMGSPL